MTVPSKAAAARGTAGSRAAGRTPTPGPNGLAGAIARAAIAFGVPASALGGIWAVESGRTYPNPYVNAKHYGGLFGLNAADLASVGAPASALTSTSARATQQQANAAAKVLQAGLRAAHGSLGGALAYYNSGKPSGDAGYVRAVGSASHTRIPTRGVASAPGGGSGASGGGGGGIFGTLGALFGLSGYEATHPNPRLFGKTLGQVTTTAISAPATVAGTVAGTAAGAGFAGVASGLLSGLGSFASQWATTAGPIVVVPVAALLIALIVSGPGKKGGVTITMPKSASSAAPAAAPAPAASPAAASPPPPAAPSAVSAPAPEAGYVGALAALRSSGYGAADARGALARTYQSGMTATQAVGAALRDLGTESAVAA